MQQSKKEFDARLDQLSAQMDHMLLGTPTTPEPRRSEVAWGDSPHTPSSSTTTASTTPPRGSVPRTSDYYKLPASPLQRAGSPTTASSSFATTITQDKSPRPQSATDYSNAPTTVKLSQFPTHEGWYFVRPEDHAQANGLSAKEVYSRRRDNRNLARKDSTEGIKVVFYSNGKVNRKAKTEIVDEETPLWLVDDRGSSEAGQQAPSFKVPGAFE